MGKASRRNNRNSKSKAERKINRDVATKNHAYNFATCKSTRKITRVRASSAMVNKRSWHGVDGRGGAAPFASGGYSNIHHIPSGDGGLAQVLFEE